ncbi:MAG: heavy metal translocating P-type ATPase [Actinomycetia bacterium]|nr:heavy metal translocating P-type ATPase [Actinomycetes bacterium]
MPTPELAEPGTARLEIAVGGMTCASCAARIERKLNRLDGVRASVNYATETATVRYDADAVTPAALAATIEATGYTARLPQPASPSPGVPGAGSADRTDAPTRELRSRLGISAALTVPVLALAMVPAAQFDNWQWLCLTLASPVVVWGGWVFHRAAWQNLRHATATMDTLVSMGALAAWGWSLYALFFGSAGTPGMRMRFDVTATAGDGASDTYLEVAAGVVVFLLLGRYLEARAKHRSGAALRALLGLGAKEVTALRDGTEVRVPIDELGVGGRFVARPGERIATDGVVAEGSSAVDESLLTGESTPIEVGPGSVVTGATINVGGRLVVRATRVGADTKLAQLARLVTAAQSGKAPVQRLADRISRWFVPAVLLAAVATAVITAAVGLSAVRAFTAAVAVLIVACPCALGLATPTALLVGTGRGAQLGLLIKGPEVLETTRRVDTIVLDKTGTLTTGRMSLLGVCPAPGVDASQLLRRAGAVEAASEHPVAAAIAAAARERLGPPPAIESFRSAPGLGASATVEGRTVAVGQEALLAAHAMVSPDGLGAALASAREQAGADGHSTVLVGWDGATRGLLVVGDTVREASAPALAQLRRLGLRPVLLTGDNRGAAHAVANALGIGEVSAEVSPEQKLAAIAELQARGRVVAMVGDGVNDAAALARADLGLAMGTGTDVAIEASDITLVRGDLRAAADAIRLSRRTLRTIKGNLAWAFGYNAVLIPVAALGLLSPLLAGAAMAFSSVFVVTNSLRLRNFRAVRQ